MAFDSQRAGGLWRTLAAAAFLSAQPVIAPDCFAQKAADASRQAYPRAYFDPYNPQTARDMVDRLPGFTLDLGDDIRGFGAGAGNVLIDGARPSSKSGGLEEALSRIPADDVDRIEVVRGAVGAGEAAGQAVVANIIRVGKERSGRWKAEIERSAENLVYPRVEATLSQKIGAWTTSTKANGFWEQYDLVGERITIDEARRIDFSQREDRPSVLTQGFVSTEAKRPLAGGELTLNGRGGYSGFFPVTDRFRFDGRTPDGSPDGRLYIDLDSVQTQGEASADWTRTFANDWTVKGLALASIKLLRDETVSRSEAPVGDVVSTSIFTLKQTPVETIARATLSRGGQRAFRPEFGGEIAYNRLASALDLSVMDADGGVDEIALPAADVLVEELRGEAFANFVWKLSSIFTLEGGLAAEASEISVSGDTENRQSFFFLKPSASVIYNARENLQLRLSARRLVGQLDFTEFAASADAADDRFLGGNPELGPDQKTRLAFAVDWRAKALGAVNIELFHEWRDDVIEYVVLPSGAFGVANAGSARVWGLEGAASLRLEPVIPGGLIEAKAVMRDSEYRDPITGEARDVVTWIAPDVSVNFRQDLVQNKIAWGFGYKSPFRVYRYYADEISDLIDGPQWTAFVETTRFFNLKSRVSLRNIGRQTFTGERRFFEPDRSGAFSATEFIDRSRGMFVTLTFEGQI